LCANAHGFGTGSWKNRSKAPVFPLNLGKLFQKLKFWNSLIYQKTSPLFIFCLYIFLRTEPYPLSSSTHSAILFFLKYQSLVEVHDNDAFIKTFALEFNLG
ncbi:MAG: hypothetical protein LBT00_07340, partial [Spirochaetaceae bacterium]|nr:hypothetical protein [Spirochaetaceae bacterium]